MTLFLERKNIMEIYGLFKTYKEEINGVAISKDSYIIDIILNKIKSVNIDEVITYKKIVNALNIAMFSGQNRMVNKITPLFRKQITGRIEDVRKVSNEAVSYIIDNDDFIEYINKINGEYKLPKYIVYDGVNINIEELGKSKKLVGNFVR